MRILFVAPYVPSLIRVRPFHWIKSLTQLGHQVTVFALGTDGPERDAEAQTALAPLCESVRVIPHSRVKAALSCAASLPTPTPLWAAYCASRPMEDALRQVVQTERFDVAHFEHLRAAPFAGALRGRLPLVFDAVDCLTDLQAQMRRAPGRGLLPRLVSWEEEVKLRRYEPRLAAQFDRTLITSRTDADALRALADAQLVSPRIDIVPNGVDLEYFRPQPPPAPGMRSVVFSGKMSYAANHDAALYFATRIWPRVRAQCPDATLTLAGSRPHADLLALGARPELGIEITGHVADLRPFLARATVAVCPLRIGVGIQNKALEAMAMARAVVATPLAVRALPPDAPGRVLRVADAPDAFADAVTHLLTHPDEAGRLGEVARGYVKEHHDWHRLAVHVATIYAEGIRHFPSA